MSNDIKTFQMAKLLNRYYEKVGLAFCGQGACPKAVEFRAGFGLVDDTDPANPTLLNIPTDMVDVPNEFFRAFVETSYSNGNAVCKCSIPQGSVASPQRYNLVGICDQDGDLIAVCTTLPDWATPTKTQEAYASLTFPLEEVAANA